VRLLEDIKDESNLETVNQMKQELEDKKQAFLQIEGCYEEVNKISAMLLENIKVLEKSKGKKQGLE
jgi:hypothetical protein